MDQSVKHLNVAIKILEKNAGNTDAAVADLDKYIKAHEKELIRLRVHGLDLFRSMSARQKKDFQKKALDRTLPLKTRIDNLLKTYKHPEKIAVRLHRLL